MRAPFFVTAATGTADLLATELAALGVAAAHECGRRRLRGHAGNRLPRLPLVASRDARAAADRARSRPPTPKRSTPASARSTGQPHWRRRTLAVDFTSAGPGITHTQFGAQVKDAVVDQFRERDRAPAIGRHATPDVRINVHLDRDVATLAIDLSGESLHRRGYRGGAGAAPLQGESGRRDAAARRLAGDRARAGGRLRRSDVRLGHAAIEAALIAGDVAPGLLRNDFGFLGWRGHDAGLWQRC